MTQTLKEKQDRLARRKQAGYAGPIKGDTAPGSMNDHKPAPKGNGRRSKDKIKADSRNATSV